MLWQLNFPDNSIRTLDPESLESRPSPPKPQSSLPAYAIALNMGFRV